MDGQVRWQPARDKRKSWLYPAIALAVFWPMLYFIVQYFMT